MTIVLVTGSKGFIGQNFCVALKRSDNIQLLTFDSNNSLEELNEYVKSVDLVFHLAGVNRPKYETDFITGNIILTQQLCSLLIQNGRNIPIVFSSTIQAELNNHYGQSKRVAEDSLIEYSRTTGASIYIYRLPNVFGKWGRPNYNSVISTFCYNITHGIPISVKDRDKLIQFVYVDEVVSSFIEIVYLKRHEGNYRFYEIANTFNISLGKIQDLLVEFEQNRYQGIIPDLSDPFTKNLYSTFISYINPNKIAYPARLNTDKRGWLFELIKSPIIGQFFVSSTQSGAIRGNHYHDSKVEKFCVIKGRAIIRLRSIFCDSVIEYNVNDKYIQIIDIPPGYSHSIENTGDTELLTLFWSNEIHDASHPDTWPENVLV